MGLFRKGKTCVTAKFQRTDIIICSHSREGKTLSYSRINMDDKDANFNVLEIGFVFYLHQEGKTPHKISEIKTETEKNGICTAKSQGISECLITGNSIM